MMLRPVRWKALLIDLCSLHAHTHTHAYANTYTHIQHILLGVDAAMHTYTSILLLKGPYFCYYSAFHTVGTAYDFP